MLDKQQKYAVISNHPYYPEIDYCCDLVEAREKASKEKAILFVDDGAHQAEILIVQILEVERGQSHY